MDVMCIIEIDNLKIYAGNQLTGRIIYHFGSSQIINGIKVKILGKATWEKEEIMSSSSSLPLKRNSNTKSLMMTKKDKINSYHHNYHQNPILNNTNSNNIRHYYNYTRNQSKRHLGFIKNSNSLSNHRKDIKIYRETENFLRIEFYIFGSDNDEISMAPGTYIYQLNYTIPSNSPSSFKCEKFIFCSVEYQITSERIIQSAPYEDAKEEFYVLKFIDLNSIPEAMNSKQIEIIKSNFTPSFCYSKPFILTAKLSKIGFIPGNELNIKINYKSKSKYSLKKIRISLCLYLKVFSNLRPESENYEQNINSNNISSDSRNNNKILKYNRYITLTKTYLDYFSKDEQEFDCNLLIPSFQPWCEDKCNLFEIGYVLKFKVKFGFPHKSLEAELPIMLGNKPIIMNEAEPKELNKNNELLNLIDVDDAEENLFKQIQYELNNQKSTVTIL